MHISEFQKKQAEWSQQQFGDQPAHFSLLGVVEEVGELSHSHLKSEQGIRTNEDHIAGKRDAVGDILMYLSNYCTASGFELQEIAVTVLEEVMERNWVDHKVNGKPEVVK